MQLPEESHARAVITAVLARRLPRVAPAPSTAALGPPGADAAECMPRDPSSQVANVSLNKAVVVLESNRGYTHLHALLEKVRRPPSASAA